MAIKGQLTEELDRMLDLGVIEQAEEATPWVNSIVVAKADGKLRVCLDPKDLNKVIVRERFQLPTREDIFSGMHGATCFSKLDASQAFWQIKLAERSKNLTTFNTPFGRYQYCRLPYGLSSAPEVFHKAMEVMMEGLEGVRVYMDDIVVWGKTVEEHDRRLNTVKDRIIKYNLLMNWKKCQIRMKELKFIGEMLSKDGVRPCPDQVSAIMNMTTPDSREAVQRALGVINYVGKFVDNLASRCVHLRKLLCKETAWHWEAQHEAEWAGNKKKYCRLILCFHFMTPDCRQRFLPMHRRMD